MKPDDLNGLTLWKDGHLTDVAVSCLIDDEIPDDLAKPMRDHLQTCEACKTTFKMFLKVDHRTNPEE